MTDERLRSAPAERLDAGTEASLASDGALRADNEAMKAILSSVPELSGSDEQREMAQLRDSFLEQLPEQCRVESVRAAWRELWAKALTFLSSSQMHRLGKAFIFAAKTHDLLIDDRANDIRHLCILNVADVCYLQLYNIDRPIGYKYRCNKKSRIFLASLTHNPSLCGL